MRTSILSSTIIALAVASVCAPAFSQTSTEKTAAPMTRSQVRMDAKDFKNSHRYDEVLEVWTLKPEYDAPKGMKSRAEVAAERDKFLSQNRYDAGLQDWVKLPGAPREMSTMTREEVKRERDAFLSTHTFNSELDTWSLKKPRK
jgi:hypothetical protein